MSGRAIIYLFLGAFLFQTLAFQGCLAAAHFAGGPEKNSGHAVWICFPEKQFAKYALNNSEFLYNGNLYDVISQRTEHGATILLCKMDTKEKELLEKIFEQLKNSKSKKELSFSFYGDACRQGSMLYHAKDEHAHYSSFSASLRLQAIEKHSPPPKA